MLGRFKKKGKYSIIVTPDDLKMLSGIVTSNFDEIRYTIKTIDGAEYMVNGLDEVLEYSNPSSRRIEMFRIEGNQEKGNGFYLPNISISLFDTAIYDASFILQLEKMDEKDIVFYTNKFDEFFKRIRAPYWIIHKDGFYWAVGLILYFLCAIIYQIHFNTLDIARQVYNILILQGVSAVCMFFSIFVLRKILVMIYPESIFAIGEQERYKIKKEKVRYLILWTIVGALVLGIISSIIATLIVNAFIG